MIKDRIIMLVIIIGSILIFWFTDFGRSGQVRVYDCGMAEWHPDIPNAVKEECRRIRHEEWQKEHELKKKIIKT